MTILIYTGLINQYRKYMPLAETTEALKGSSDQIDNADKKILEACHLLASKKSIFAELGSCISIAGLLKTYNDKVGKGHQVVCVLTGNGLNLLLGAY